MKITRRKFSKKGLLLGVGLPLFGTKMISCTSPAESKKPTDEVKPSPLKILILGGTSFLGPHQIAYALKRGHTVTTFTRGKTQPTIHTSLFDQVESLIGDRADNLTALENRKWDVVIDNSGRNVEWTNKSAELLKDNVELYLYTSSTGVYYPYLRNDIGEDTELLMEEPEGIEDEEMKIEYWYGVMKTNSELAAKNIFGKDRTILARPTYMIGPGDKSDRFIHWPLRLAQGGNILVPGKEADEVQYLDVRDAAEFMIRLAESKSSGTYNIVGPQNSQTMYQFVDAAEKDFKSEKTFTYVNDYDFLIEQNVHHIVPWIMPVGNNVGSAKINNKRALEQGLTFRPLSQTIKDTYDWWQSDALTNERRDKYLKNMETVFNREEAILSAWANN